MMTMLMLKMSWKHCFPWLRNNCSLKKRLIFYVYEDCDDDDDDDDENDDDDYDDEDDNEQGR